MEHAIEAYVSREVPNIFKEHSLVAVNEVLPGQVRIDFHFKSLDKRDVFVEVIAKKVDRTKLSRILNIYASIANINPPLMRFELIVVAPEVTASVREELKKLSVALLTYEEIGITRQKLYRIQERDLLRQQEMLHLSPEEAKLIAKWESEKKVVVRASDVREALDCSPNYAYFLLHKLESKHWLERVTQGLYQFIPLSYGYPERVPPSNSYIIAAALIKPYYFSYYTSNSYYGFTTQMPFTLFIATTKKKSSVEWSSGTFKFITLSKHKFFGYKREKVFDTEVHMADPEKSLVDSFDKPRYIGGIEQLMGITWRGIKRVNMKKLVKYAVRMKSHVLIQRIGFAIDFLSKEQLVEPLPQSLRKKMLRHIGKTVIYLDSRRSKTGKYYKEWKVINNVTKAQLLSEIDIR